MGNGVKLILLSALLAPCYAMAVLGGAPSANKAATEKNVLAASSKIAASGPYTIEETVDTSGTRLREYVNTDGIVFALAWQGPRIPDLRSQLGQYYAQLQAEIGRAHV